MSYTPTTWTSGDTITASKLNKIEQGIAESGSGGGWDIIIKVVGTLGGSNTTYTLLTDGTAADLYDKLLAYDPVTCLVIIIGGSGMYFQAEPYVCTIHTYSVVDTLYISHSSWPSGHSICFNSSGVSWS